MKNSSLKDSPTGLEEILEHLDLQELASRIADAAVREINGYRDRAQEWGRRETRKTALANLQLFRQLVLDEGELADEQLGPAREAARVAAMCGLPLSDLLRTYHLGYRVAFTAVRKLADDERAALAEGIAPFIELAGALDLAVVEAYTSAGPPPGGSSAQKGDGGAEPGGFLDVLHRIDLDALAERMVSAILAQVPGFDRPPREPIRERLTVATAAQLVLLPRLVEEERNATEDELEPFREAARGHARDGVALEDLLLAYQVGAAVAWDEVRRVTESTGNPSAGLVGTEPTMRYAEQLGMAVNQAYLEERARIATEPAPRQRSLFDALLEDRPITPELQELAAELAFSPDDRLRPFAQMRSSATEAIERAELLRNRGVLAFADESMILGLCLEQQDPDELLSGGGPFAIAEPTSKPELRAALAETRILSALGAWAERSGRVDSAEFTLERLLLGSPALASSLEERVLRPLQEGRVGRGIDLLPTLVAFVQSDQERKRTAELLHIHPNTLDHRLRRFRAITGMDLARADDLASVELALKWRQLKVVAETVRR